MDPKQTAEDLTQPVGVRAADDGKMQDASEQQQREFSTSGVRRHTSKQSQEEDAREDRGASASSDAIADEQDDKSGDVKVMKRRARRREIGANARQRERAEVDRLEKELVRLQELVNSRRTLHLCVQCTGLEQLLRENPTLAQDKLHAQENFKVVLRVLQSSLEGGRGKEDAIPGLINECMTLFRNTSSLCCSTAWHGAALLVMQDGFFMNHPAMPSLLGDLPMSTWLLAYLSREGPNLPAITLQDLTATLKNWNEVEADLNAQVAKWLQVVREQSVGHVQASLMERLQPGEDRGKFTLLPQPENEKADVDVPIAMSRFATNKPSTSFAAGPTQHGMEGSDPAVDKSGALPEGGEGSVMPLMVCCCHLVQRDEEFRCWALSLMQSKLGMWDFAQFLVTRLTYEDTIREMAQHAASSAVPQAPGDDEGVPGLHPAVRL